MEGYDAAAKAAILANVAFGARVVAGDVYREGISAITAADITAARQPRLRGEAAGGRRARRRRRRTADAEESVAVRVHPAMVPLTHPLAAVRDSFNAVFVEGDAIGELMFLGRGAGGMPTASAVLGDLLDAAHNLTTGGAGRSVALRRHRPSGRSTTCEPSLLPDPAGRRPSRRAARRVRRARAAPGVDPADGAGGPARIRRRSSPGTPMRPRTVARPPGQSGARLVFVTHPAFERDVQACLHDLRQLDVVERIGGLLRVVGR